MQQISIFTENKKGAMNQMTQLLADNDINITALLTNDSAEFGIVRMLVSDTMKACRVFSEAGYMVKSDSVLAVYMEDVVGSLNGLLNTITDLNVNIDYMYITFDRNNASPIAVIKTGVSDELTNALEYRGYKVY